MRERISEPLPGEVRLQWWRDVVEGTREPGGHPVAACIREVILRHDLPVGSLHELIDARTFDLYDDPMPTLDALCAYARKTSSALIALAMRILGMPGPDDLGASDQAGIAYAITGLLRAFPLHAARGQVFVPGEVLDRHGVRREEVLAGAASPGLIAALGDMRRLARRALDDLRERHSVLPRPLVPAVLPVALTDLYLERMERRDYAPLATPVVVPQWRRQWALWRAARALGRISSR